MSMNINGLGNTYNSINTNSKQYKALKEKGWLSGVIANESMMSPEEKMIYEIFGGRDTIIKNLMKQFDSDGDLLNSNGVAGMDVTGKGTSWQKLTNISEDHRQKMFDNVKREFIQEKGLSNGDTTKRSDIFKDYQLSVSKDKRLSGTWTLEQYEGQYRAAMYAAVKSANPNWKPGQAFDASYFCTLFFIIKGVIFSMSASAIPLLAHHRCEPLHRRRAQRDIVKCVCKIL